MILVTGGTGRVGRHLVKRLLEEGEDVRILARDREKIDRTWSVDIVEGDVTDEKDVEQAMQGVDIVYHLAALTDYSVPHERMWSVNVEGTRNIMDLSEDKKIIYLSTTAVLGHKIEKLPADEDTPYNPTDYYGTTKMEAEKIALDNDAIVLRAPVIYGPGFENIFFTLFDAIKEKKMMIIGEGENRIQYIHIDDLVDALILAKENARKGQVYLVTGNDIKTQKELFGMVAEMLGSDAPKKHMSEMTARIVCFFDRKKANILKRLMADRMFNTEKARGELGFSPKTNYKKGIWELVEMYKVRRSQQGKK